MWAIRSYVLCVMRRKEETPNKDVKADRMKGDVEVFRNTKHLRSLLARISTISDMMKGFG